MNYSDKTQYIAQVNEKDEVTGKIEKWDAHKAGVLHRAFTVTIFFENQILLQYRKHPVFDQVFDATVSSHQIFTSDKLQEDIQAVLETLKREWKLSADDLMSTPAYKGFVQYKAKDPRSEFIEHEICHIYSCEVKKLTLPDFDFAYGFCLKSVKELKSPFDPIYPLLAPWVHKAMEDNLL